jgi:hypothetical protein
MNERGFCSMGMVRGSRKGLPDILTRKMQHGEFMFRTKGCVAPIKWQDNKPVKVLPMQHNPIEVTSVKWKNRNGTWIFPCLAAIAEYNAIKGGVNRFNQR